MQVDVAAHLPPLPRVGLELCLPARLEQVDWFGLGPHENYPDRRAAALVDRHQARVEELHVPYIYPSESGGRGQVRWVRLCDARQRGLHIGARPFVQMAARRYRQQDLAAALHQTDLSYNFV